MKRLSHFFAFIANFWFLSCNSGVEVERILPENLIAVSSLISPQDSVISVNVYQGKALGDIARSDAAVIKDAQVTIEEGNTIHQLVFEPKTNSYVISNHIVKVAPSKQYHLQVITKSGPVLNAVCTVPSDPDKVSIEGIKEGNDYAFNLDWPALGNVSFFTFNFELKDVIFKPQLGASTGPYLGFVTGNNLFDNRDRPDKSVENKVFNAYLADKVSLRTILYSLDENAFYYLKTKMDAYNWSANTGGLIPNLREPQPVFSNVQGGVGIFGAYNQSINLTIIK